MNAQPQEEFCPRCGVWVSVLDEWTGWCEPCAKRTRRVFAARGAEERHCGGCDEMQPVSEFAASSYRCRSCETEQKRAWRAANRDRERAYQATRPRGRCPECLQMTWLTQAGVLTNHLYRMRRVYSGERCAGSGQPPTLVNPHVRVDPEPSEANTT